MTGLNFVDVETKRDVPRDGYGRPMIVPKAGGKPVAHIRTTTFIDCLEDKTNVADWRTRGVLVSAMKFPEVAKEALSLDPEDKDDKQKLNRLAERLFDMGGFNWKREKGTELHKLTEYVDAGEQLPVGLPLLDLADMAAYMLATINLKRVFIERLVVVNELPTAGTPDRVSEYEGPGPDGKPMKALLIDDLKTGDVSYGGLKIAAQLAVYARGEFYDHTVFPEVDTQDKKAWTAWKKTEFDADLAATAYSPLPPEISRDWGIVTNLRPGSGEATLHWVDLRLGWEAALMAKQIRALRSRSGKALTQFA